MNNIQKSINTIKISFFWAFLTAIILVVGKVAIIWASGGEDTASFLDLVVGLCVASFLVRLGVESHKIYLELEKLKSEAQPLIERGERLFFLIKALLKQ